MTLPILIDGENLSLEDVKSVACKGIGVSLSDYARQRVRESRRIVEEYVDRGEIVYGITTGFGKFSDVVISRDERRYLQKNLIMSHAAGVGAPLDEEIVRAIMLLRANALAKGYSGVREEILDTLLEMINKRVHPVIPEKGSVGASGDLAPLAHMVLVMLGEGEAYCNGTRMPGKQAMATAGIQPITLEAKEGVALINGTQVMTAIGIFALLAGENLVQTADIAAAMTMEALGGILLAFDERVQRVRPHPGQIRCAENIRLFLEQSEILEKANHGRVQDAYTLRCIPQVHGAARDALAYVRSVLEREINSATDNPLIFTETGEIISGGNFHGQPIAIAMDILGIVLSVLGNIAERRIERLLNPVLSGLPAFLTEKGGLNSGFMVSQYTAAALVSENKVLSHPASVDSIPTSANQEDHVSMGTIAARKALEISANLQNILAIELLCAAQGIDYRHPSKPGIGTGIAHRIIRQQVPHLTEDRILYRDISKVVGLIKDGIIVTGIEKFQKKKEVAFDGDS